MTKVVLLVEEPSLKEFLDNYLPRLLPELDFLCIRHEGKQDLERSIPRKLRAWQGGKFVVMRDNDGANCRDLKTRLRQLCLQANRSDTLVRLVCQELESWYLGVPETLAEVYARPFLADIGRKAKYRDPDVLGNPSRELLLLVPEFRKLDGARRMGRAMPTDPTRNRSHSFQVFVAGLFRIIQAEK